MTLRKVGLQFFCLLLLLTGLVKTGQAQAATSPQLRLIVDNRNPQMDDIINLQVLLEDVPTIYGADIQLTFDPTVWQVIDGDEAKTGVQPAHGNFIEADKAFVLQHQANNEDGVIDYALTLLNPAPPSQGDGLLMQVQLKAIAETATEITITEALLGTQSGETITLNTEKLEITVGEVLSDGSLLPSESTKSQPISLVSIFDWRNLLIAFLVAALLMMGIRQFAGLRTK